HLRKVTMIPQKKGEKLWINGKVFRGIFEFWPEKRGGFCVVNVLNVEDYLRGVLPPEIGKRNKDEFAALKAQAVAARTYALSTKDKYADKEYDLINDIRDQVYTGIAGETDQTDKAISKTRGEALTYWGELIQAYYHSTCSGQTENIEEVWEREPIPYLRSVKDADFCHWSKFYDWNELFDTAELLQNIRSYLAENNRPTGLVGDTLRDLKITAKTTTGRVRSVTVTTDKGSIILHKDQIRWAFGRAGTQGIMRSTNFTLDLERNGDGSVGKVHVTGYGYGHGVGMCQCGAIGMARAGFDYQAILKNYYTGVKIEKLY
ncbi:MAG: SpoIID/LytB domain-containing protein, partial [candidate division Zixibacteria bacterium]|nr:SpoIID/LytB domain-containing protein [candidate division Zixibacteria bacterium]